jgi:hypothetical protein
MRRFWMAGIAVLALGLVVVGCGAGSAGSDCSRPDVMNQAAQIATSGTYSDSKKVWEIFTVQNVTVKQLPANGDTTTQCSATLTATWKDVKAANIKNIQVSTVSMSFGSTANPVTRLPDDLQVNIPFTIPLSQWKTGITGLLPRRNKISFPDSQTSPLANTPWKPPPSLTKPGTLYTAISTLPLSRLPPRA